MYVIPGKQCRVTLETQEGMVLTGSVYVASVSQQVLYDGFSTWSMELEGIDEAPIMTMPRNEVRVALSSMKEWRCDYCGVIHPMSKNLCTQCGGYRSILYGE